MKLKILLILVFCLWAKAGNCETNDIQHPSTWQDTDTLIFLRMPLPYCCKDTLEGVIIKRNGFYGVIFKHCESITEVFEPTLLSAAKFFCDMLKIYFRIEEEK